MGRYTSGVRKNSEIFKCLWLQDGDTVEEVSNSVYIITRSSGKYFIINHLGDFFITAAHCLDDYLTAHSVCGRDVAIYNAANGVGGDEVWPTFRDQLACGRFNKHIPWVIGRTRNFKAGESGLLCGIKDCKTKLSGFLLVSGSSEDQLCNGLLPWYKECGSAGCVVQDQWQPRDATVTVFSGESGHRREMFGVEWDEFECHSKTLNRVMHAYHILSAEEKKHSNSLHQFPDLVADKVHDLKKIHRVKVPLRHSNKCLEFQLDQKVFSWHETRNRLIFAVLPAFQSTTMLLPGTPIFSADTHELISCVTLSHNSTVYAVSGVGWESGQVEVDDRWMGISCQYVGKGESVYGKFHGSYSDTKSLAAVKATEKLGEKTGLGIYMLDNMIQVVAYDENGKERWRVRLFHENCHVVDI